MYRAIPPVRLFFTLSPRWLSAEKKIEVNVDPLSSSNSASRFMTGFFFGAVIAAAIMVALCNAGDYSPFMAQLHALQQVIVTVLVSLVIVDAKPFMYKTVWRERRCSFILDEDISATLRGRTFGIPAGVLVGILIQNFVVS